MNSNTISGPLLIGLFVTIFIVIAIVAANQQKKRVAELTALAERLNFTFLPSGIPLENSMDLFSFFGFSAPAVPNPYSAEFINFFPLFSNGSSRRILPAMVGSDSAGSNWFLFDYQYTVSSGKSSHTHHFSVVVVQAKLAFPTMSLAPENVGFSVGKFFGMRELQVESEEFNKRYFIKTADEKMSLDLLHPVAIEALLKQPPYEWQMAGPFVMIHLDHHISGSEYEGLMSCVQEFLNQVPTYYRQDYGATGAHH